jgi:hypothetical protein
MSTKGELRVRTTFNPSDNSTVAVLKQKSAELINLVEEIPGTGSEIIRLKSLAQTAYEEAAMWAVKAATL